MGSSQCPIKVRVCHAGLGVVFVGRLFSVLLDFTLARCGHGLGVSRFVDAVNVCVAGVLGGPLWTPFLLCSDCRVRFSSGTMAVRVLSSIIVFAFCGNQGFQGLGGIACLEVPTFVACH